MASPRTNRDDIQNSRTLRPPLSKQSSFVIGDGEVEIRNNNVKTSRFLSLGENQQPKMEFPRLNSDSNKNSDSTDETILHRSVSSNELFRQFRERPPLHRTISSIVSGNIPPPKAEVVKRDIKSKNGNMVLQLVLPSTNQVDNGNYLTTTSFEEILVGGANTRPRSMGSQQDLYSTVGAESYVNHAYTNDLGDYNHKISQSPLSTTSTTDPAKSTLIEDKKRFFRQNLVNILCSMYAIFIITVGLAVYIADILISPTATSEIFNLYLVVVAFVFILYLTIDIKRYMNKKHRYEDLLQQNVSEEIELKESPNGGFHLNIKLPEAIRATKQLEHHYCLSKDRHSANFYLKVGAAGFCIGHLIHSGLLVGYQILFLTSDSDAFYECASVASLVLDIIYPIYSFLLLYFIFKYSNVVINRNVLIARFGMMHCLASSLCFWVWTIIRETIESLAHHDHDETTTTPTTPSEISFFTGQPVALPLTAYDRIGANSLKTYLNTSIHQFVGECSTDEGMTTIYRNYSPYLYPFSVEYSILVVGVLFVIWQSIGKCKEKEEMSSTRQCDSPVGNDDNHESNIVIHVDCHSANKGLFCGIIIMVLTAVSVILFLVAVNDNRYEEGSVVINYATSIVINALMIITGILAYHQITKLDISHGHVSLLDDLLLFICIPAFFLDGILAIGDNFSKINTWSLILTFTNLIQIIIQTPLIIDGLRRCSNSKELRKEKPGRELLTFLTVANLAMWIMATFEVKSHDSHKDSVYGEEVVSIILHLCAPLMMFYRFHSSVCIADIWKYAYQPNSH